MAQLEWNLEFDEPIAERIIPGADCEIVVQLGPPRQQFSNGDLFCWYCPYRINGIPNDPDHKRFVAGEDAIEAIIHTLSIIGAELNSELKDQLGLNWGDENGYLGFLDGTKLPGYKPPTPQRQAANQAIYDVYANPTATEQDRKTALDKWAENIREE
jgi:hypothetical protein